MIGWYPGNGTGSAASLGYFFSGSSFLSSSSASSSSFLTFLSALAYFLVSFLSLAGVVTLDYARDSFGASAYLTLAVSSEMLYPASM